MLSSNPRRPVVAGKFYPKTKSRLKEQIAGFAQARAQKKDVIACLLPHAGYIYSGKAAVLTAGRIFLKPTIILIGPNHTGMGAAYSIMAGGSWQTPLGEVGIDQQFAGALLKRCPYLEDDPDAHLQEHSLEVELPILQYFKSDFKIVPICLGSDDLPRLKQLGRDIAAVIKERKAEETTLLVASSDMTHYEPQAEAKAKDKEAIGAICRLDEEELVEKVSRYHITMCGVSPVIVMLSAAKLLGATRGELAAYQTSGETSGDMGSVVGYAGILVY